MCYFIIRTTLLHCVPLEHERKFFEQCRDNHRRIEETLRQVKTIHAQISAGVNELMPPNVDFDRLNHLLEIMAHESNLQVIIQYFLIV